MRGRCVRGRVRLLLLGWRGSGGDCRNLGGDGPQDQEDLRPAPENSVTREFGAYARIEDCEKRGYKEMILRRCFAG